MHGERRSGSHVVTENRTAQTTLALLRQLRTTYTQPLTVVWANGPARRGVPIRTYLTTPGLNLRLVRSRAYSPAFNADYEIWDWVHEEVTVNACLGTKAKQMR